MSTEPLLFRQGKTVDVREKSEAGNFFFRFDWRLHYYDGDPSRIIALQHFHDFYEVVVPVDQPCSFMIEGQMFQLQPFDMVCINRGFLHTASVSRHDVFNRLVIQSRTELCPKWLSENQKKIESIFAVSPPVFRFDEPIAREIFAPINDLFIKSERGIDITPLYACIKLSEFFCLIAEHLSDNLYRLSPRAASSIISEITAFINANLCADLSLHACAKQFNISACYLSHLFRQETGRTLSEFVQSARVGAASQLLVFTNKKISEVLVECGFSSFAQFNRTFLKYNGVAPRKYREEMQKKGQ